MTAPASLVAAPTGTITAIVSPASLVATTTRLVLSWTSSRVKSLKAIACTFRSLFIRIPLVSLVGTLSIGEARGLRQWLVAGLTRNALLGSSLGRFLPKLAGCGSSAAGLSGSA